ncbi:hypothetical protein [Bacillus sp. REN3]|uniref:hypothetical protein n=1 Tax=Bacillus sp. REN3 TaxID=2802440 RepID=UPI001AEE9926|nr:hypothetical protein [Bacillus sp. REN3]
MEALFDLITNPIVLFILIGFFSSLYNKAKGNAEDQQRPRPARPARETVDMGNPQASRRVPQQQRTTEAVEPPGTLNDIQKVYLERKRQADQQPDESRRKEKGRLGERNRIQETKQPDRNQGSSFDFQPDGDKLIEGLVWSEVLGPPRAKRPYHPPSRN